MNTHSNGKVRVIRILGDEGADTTLAYVEASAGLALWALAAVRLLVPTIASYVYRIHLLLTLPIF